MSLYRIGALVFTLFVLLANPWSNAEVRSNALASLNLGPDWSERQATTSSRLWTKSGSSEIISLKIFESASVPPRLDIDDGKSLPPRELLRIESAKASALEKVGIRKWTVHERRKVNLGGRTASLKVGSYQAPSGRIVQFLETIDDTRVILFTQESTQRLKPETVRSLLSLLDKRSS